MSAQSDPNSRFPFPCSRYVKLMSVKNPEAWDFYEAEALRNGWSLRQLERQLNTQLNTQFYERTLLSRNKASMLESGAIARPEDQVRPEDEIKDPFVLEFLNLKDEYSESDLEDASRPQEPVLASPTPSTLLRSQIAFSSLLHSFSPLRSDPTVWSWIGNLNNRAPGDGLPNQPIYR